MILWWRIKSPKAIKIWHGYIWRVWARAPTSGRPRWNMRTGAEKWLIVHNIFNACTSFCAVTVGGLYLEFGSCPAVFQRFSISTKFTHEFDGNKLNGWMEIECWWIIRREVCSRVICIGCHAECILIYMVLITRVISEHKHFKKSNRVLVWESSNKMLANYQQITQLGCISIFV